MWKVGIIGFGFMGQMHYQYWEKLEDFSVAAICDPNKNLRQEIQNISGNLKGEQETVDFSGADIYTDFEEMLAGAQLDVLSIAVPTYLHAEYSIRALQAGWHVMCEKPMALTLEECDRMIAAAQTSGKLLQIGHCVRFWPEYARAKEIVDQGQYGRIVAATFQRLATTPLWSWDNWFMDLKRSGGMALDLHIHDSDYIQYLCGAPKAVTSFGSQGSNQTLSHIVSQYHYSDDRVITAEASWMMMPSFGFEMSFNIMLENATMVYDCTRDPAFQLFTREEDPIIPEIADGDGYWQEISHFAQQIRGEQTPSVITLEQSRESIRIINGEEESIRTGRKVSLE